MMCSELAGSRSGERLALSALGRGMGAVTRTPACLVGSGEGMQEAACGGELAVAHDRLSRHEVRAISSKQRAVGV